MEVKGVINFDEEKSLGSLLKLDKQLHSAGEHTATKIIDKMGLLIQYN